MISVFIKEQKRYTQKDLITLLDSYPHEIVYIIKKLKEYGIVKSVKVSKKQKNMSDLFEEDIEIEDTKEREESYYYVFTFVGVITVFGRVLKCYPKYIHSIENPTTELAQVIEVIEKYNSKEQIIKMFNETDENRSFNLLAVILYLLHDYYENGSYENRMNIVETNGDGEIIWDKTINETFTFISNSRPYYMDIYTQKNVNDDFDYFKRLHDSIVSICSREIRKSGLEELFGIFTVDISDEELDDFGEIETILYNIQKELNRQFITRKQILLKALYAYVAQRSHLTDLTSFAMYGTNSFNLVWEQVCSEVLDNKLETRIRDLPVVFEGFKENSRLIDLIEKPKWHGKNNEFVKEAKDTLIPDIVSIFRVGETYQFIIFDAKYYNLTLEKDTLLGYPGVGDVTKQYLYQLTYKDFIKKVGFSSVKNCFLMPTEDEAVIDTGRVNLDILDNLDLESIQIRQFPAKSIYFYYLRNEKIDITKLNL